MDCRKASRYLALYLDSELSPELTFEISSHLDDCDRCGRMAELEERLERRIRERLNRAEPTDGDIWSRAVDAAMKRASYRPRRRLGLTVALAAVAATAGIIAILLGGFQQHDELDLAEATASAHADFIASGSTGLDFIGDSGDVNVYFQRELAPEFCLNTAVGTDRTVLTGGICDVNGVRAAHVFYEFSSWSVSLFWIPKSLLAAFPETEARLQAQGLALHCRVDPYDFYVNRAGSGVLVGIGSIPPDKLEDLVESAVSGHCADPRKD